MDNDSQNEHGKHFGRGVKRAATLALVLLSLFLFAKTINEFKLSSVVGKDIPPQAAINVSGKGEIVQRPDIATFYFSVTEESLVIATAQDKAAKTINSLLDFLKKNKVEDKDIQTTGYNIYPRYEYYGTSSIYPYPQGKQTLAAYVVSQSITVKVRNISDAGKLLSGLGELGVTDVSGLTFGFDKADDLRKEARREAIKDAENQAEILAKDLGVKLVRIISYSENGYGYPRYEMMSAAPLGKGGGSVAPEIPTGEQKITLQVNITYEIR